MSSKHQTALPFPPLSGALAPIGPLPDDLLSAFNAAVFNAHISDGIYRLLLSITPGSNPEPTLSVVLTMLAKLKEHREASRAAILAVFNELTAVRRDAPQLGNTGAANAHWLALEMADQLRYEIWKSADYMGWVRCLTDPAARMDPSCIVENLEKVCQHLRVVNFGYDFGFLLGQIQGEASKAAEARRLRKAEAEQAGGNGSPRDQDRTGQSEGADAKKLAPSRLKALSQYRDALSKRPAMEGATDRDVYDWIAEHSDGDPLPTFATWSRYLREARGATDTSKNTPRSGRTGRSIVRPDEI